MQRTKNIIEFWNMLRFIRLWIGLDITTYENIIPTIHGLALRCTYSFIFKVGITDANSSFKCKKNDFIGKYMINKNEFLWFSVLYFLYPLNTKIVRGSPYAKWPLSVLRTLLIYSNYFSDTDWVWLNSRWSQPGYKLSAGINWSRF